MVILSLILALLPSLTQVEVETYRYPADQPRSDKYSVSVNGKDVFVLPTEQPHIAQFGADGEVCVSVTFTEKEVRTVDVRPFEKGYEYELDGNVLSMRLRTYDRVTMEVNGDTKNPLLIFINPTEAEKVAEASSGNGTMFLRAGSRYNLKRLDLADYEGLYIQGGAIVYANVLATGKSNLKIDGCGIIDCTGLAGNAIKISEGTKTQVNNVCIINRSQSPLVTVNCVNTEVNNVKAINLPSEKMENEKTGFDFACCKGLKGDHLFAYSQSSAYNIHNRYWDTVFPVSDIELNDCIGTNALTSSTLYISGSDNMSCSGIRINGFYALHSATSKVLYKRAAVTITQEGTKPVTDISISNLYVEDPMEYGLRLEGWINGVEFKNIVFSKWPPKGSLFKGVDFEKRIGNVVFENFIIDDKKVNSLKKAGFTNPSFGLNVIFKR